MIEHFSRFIGTFENQINLASKLWKCHPLQTQKAFSNQCQRVGGSESAVKSAAALNCSNPGLDHEPQTSVPLFSPLRANQPQSQWKLPVQFESQ